MASAVLSLIDHEKNLDEFREAHKVEIHIHCEGEESHRVECQDYNLRSSQFLRTCLKHSWLEGQTRTIHLHEIDAALFEIYYRAISSGSFSGSGYKAYLDNHGDAISPLVFELWFLADYLLDTDVQNLIMSSLRVSTVDFPDVEKYDQWEHTLERLSCRDKLYKWMVRHIAIHRERVPPWRFPWYFNVDVLEQESRFGSNGRRFKLRLSSEETCDVYHVHNEKTIPKDLCGTSRECNHRGGVLDTGCLEEEKLALLVSGSDTSFVDRLLAAEQ